MSVRQNLRHTLAAVLQHCQVQPSDLTLSTFVQLDVCRRLLAALKQRGVKSGRIHTIFLMVKKILVYLSSHQSEQTKQYIQPTSLASFHFVTAVCSEATSLRKAEARDRQVLGTTGIKSSSSKPSGGSSESGESTATLTKDELATIAAGMHARRSYSINS